MSAQPIASWRLTLTQDTPAAAPPASAAKLLKSGTGPMGAADVEYPAYQVTFRGPGMPTGVGTAIGAAVAIGPHTARLNTGAGVFRIDLNHNSDTDPNPDLIVTFTAEPS